MLSENIQENTENLGDLLNPIRLIWCGRWFFNDTFLNFLGVPPTYAVANEANNILATSVSGSTTHYLKNTLDYKMGLMIVIGGVLEHC